VPAAERATTNQRAVTEGHFWDVQRTKMNERNARDLNRIGIKHDWELRNWSKEFGVAPQELKAAIAAVGFRVTDIQRYFAEHQKT
jgi:hypothetical protein